MNPQFKKADKALRRLLDSIEELHKTDPEAASQYINRLLRLQSNKISELKAKIKTDRTD